MSGTSSTNNLKNTMCCKIPITPVFGSVMNATSEGTINDQTLGQLGIKAIHIECMHHNLLSVYQVCAGGEQGEEQVGIFTSERCKFFPLSKCKEAFKIMSKCSNTFYGLVNGGVNMYAPAGTKKQQSLDNAGRMALHSVRDKDMFSHIHRVCGHMSDPYIKWHCENSKNAKFTDADAKKVKPLCKACVYGEDRQTSTDRHRIRMPCIIA